MRVWREQQPAPVLLRTAVIVVSVNCPAVFVVLLRLQLVRALAQARELATVDPLTGVLNRRGLEEQARVRPKSW